MARFTVILPEGSVLLKNKETGETLTLSAEAGPLTLGELEMSLTLMPAPFREEETPNQKNSPVSSEKRHQSFEEDWTRSLPPGFGMNEGEPFLSPSEGTEPLEANPDRPFIRVLDAPMDALVLEDFERTLETMAAQRNNMEGEIEFLEEIEADPEDIEELRKAMDRLDEDLSAVVKRKIEFEELPKKMGLVE